MKINKIFAGAVVVAAAMTSCENQDVSYADFDYQTVYFANQYPVRILELGDDDFVDNTLDNQNIVEVKATTGGAYQNGSDVVIDYVVDDLLCDGLSFGSVNTGAKVIPMPSSYYQLLSDKIAISSGSIFGGVKVKLTDAFFADPLALTANYVIPLRMTEVAGADSILQGRPSIPDPNRCIDAHWAVKPKDYVLYAVRFINPWHGNYLRRGTDVITLADGTASALVRHKAYVEYDQLVKITTSGLKSTILPLSVKGSDGKDVKFNLELTFADDQSCTVSGSSATYNITGTGKFVKLGEKKSIGGKDRNALYLDYAVDFTTLGIKYNTKDTLVVRDRAITAEYFTVVKK